MAKADELLPTMPHDAPRVLIAPDSAFRTWLSKAVRKIKASGLDGISTQVFRALLMEDEAVAFIAIMIERIVNADVGKEELASLSTLLLVLICIEIILYWNSLGDFPETFWVSAVSPRVNFRE
jgi:hypothetical protein